MSGSDSEGLLWLVAIGLGIWGWKTNEKLKDERAERIEAVARANNNLSDLKLRIVEMEREIEFAEGDIKSVSAAHESLRKTFNSNVDIENKAKVARMTARGACGTETVRFDDGGWAIRNKECTLKDLR